MGRLFLCKDLQLVLEEMESARQRPFVVSVLVFAFGPVRHAYLYVEPAVTLEPLDVNIASDCVDVRFSAQKLRRTVGRTANFFQPSDFGISPAILL